MENERSGSSKSTKSDGNDKPLKKARYAWEVKGKYHLKEKSQDDRKVNDGCDEAAQTSGSWCRKSSSEKVECNCNYSDKQTRSVDVLMSDVDKMMEFKIPKGAFSKIKIEKVVEESKPARDEALDEAAEDYYLLRWQARQLAKGFVDNTINKVLEQWRLSVHASDLFVENGDGDELVEDEGILMAIQSHGLRQDQSSDSAAVPDLGNMFDNNFRPIQVTDRLNTNERDSNPDCRDIEKKIDDTDFLSAAVSVAISNKGLSSCNYK